MKYYVYELINSLDGLVFYIGKGSGNRLYKHLKIAQGKSKNKDRNPKLYNKINSIIGNGGTIIVKKIFETDSEQDAFGVEVKTIKGIGLDNLTNLTVGGEGTSFPNGFTEEHRRNISLSKKGKVYPYMFLPRSEEQKKNMSIASKNRTKAGFAGYWKGRKLSEETKLKMSLAHKGKKLSDEHRRHLSEALMGKRNKDGHRVPIETKDKISKSLSEHYDSQDGEKTREILSNIGKSQLVNGKRVLSLDARQKMSEGAKKGNKFRRNNL